MARKVIIDAGHGGVEPGAIFNGRKEKDDTLQLAFDLGSALERRGIQVEYTRVNDVYDSPYEKASIANRSDADFFVSLQDACIGVVAFLISVFSDNLSELFLIFVVRQIQAVKPCNKVV